MRKPVNTNQIEKGMIDMQRPTAVTVIGILNIVFGALALMCLPFAIIGFLAPRMGGQNIMLDIMDQSPFFKFWNIGMTAMGLLVAIVLIVAGIFLLMMKEMGRLMTIGYGFYGITMSVINTAVSAIFMVGPMMAQMNQGGSPEAAGASVGGMLGVGCSLCLGLAYPITALILMTRPAIADAFKAK